VAKGLRRFGVDVTTSSGADLLEAADLVHLEYARKSGRVIITYDADYVILHRRNVEHAGIVYVPPRSRSIGHIIEVLYLLYELSLPDEMLNRLEYL
jgi:hypothetical protein